MQGLGNDGLTSGLDMTFEAGMTKLCYLLGQGLSPDAIKAVSFNYFCQV